LNLRPVPAPEVESNWHFADAWVRAAVEEGALLETSDSYKARCLDASAQLWLIEDQGQCIGAMVTEVYDTPKGLTCAVPVISAVSFDDALVPLFSELETWARNEGCVRLEGFGRFGWIRALKPHGWRPLAAVIEKDI
jgi:hypothetical protein